MFSICMEVLFINKYKLIIAIIYKTRYIVKQYKEIRRILILTTQYCNIPYIIVAQCLACVPLVFLGQSSEELHSTISIIYLFFVLSTYGILWANLSLNLQLVCNSCPITSHCSNQDILEAKSLYKNELLFCSDYNTYECHFSTSWKIKDS